MLLQELIVPLKLGLKEFSSGIENAKSQLAGFDNQALQGLSAVGGGILAGGIAAVGAGIAAAGAGLIHYVGAAAEAEQIQAQLNAVLTSTGGVSGMTVDSVNDLANSLSRVTMFEDDAIVASSNLMLTFTNIGSDIFPRAQASVLDMATAMGTDLPSATMLLSKALNDPIGGISALGRAGVQFTDEQKEMIKSMVETNDMAGAQAIIMGEVETQFKGSAEAAGNTFAGKLGILKNNFDNIGEGIGGVLLPGLTTLATMFSDALNKPETIAFLDGLTQSISTMANNIITWIPQAFQFLQDAFGWLSNNQGVIVGALAAVGVAIAAFVYTTVVPAMISLITTMAPVIAIMAVVALAGYLLYQAWTTNFGGIRDIVTNVWNNLQPVFNNLKAWLEVAIPAALSTLAGFWQNTLLPAIEAVWSWMQGTLFPFIGSLADVLSATLGVAVTALAGLWQNVLQPALEDVWPILQDIGAFVGGALSGAFDTVSKAIQGATEWLSGLADKLRKLKLPSWLQPGSPPPLYWALRDIQTAMKDLNNGELPDFSSNLAMDGINNPTSSFESKKQNDDDDIIEAIKEYSLNNDKFFIRLRDSILQGVG